MVLRSALLAVGCLFGTLLLAERGQAEETAKPPGMEAMSSSLLFEELVTVYETGCVFRPTATSPETVGGELAAALLELVRPVRRPTSSPPPNPLVAWPPAETPGGPLVYPCQLPAPVSPPPTTQLPAVEQDPYYSRLRAYEDHYAEKVRNALSFIPGVVVNVSANLDRRLRYTETERLHDTRSLIVDEAPLTPQRFSVVVSIPRDYLTKTSVANDQLGNDAAAVEPTGQSLIADIESLVFHLIPSPPPGEDPYASIYVHLFTPVQPSTAAALAAAPLMAPLRPAAPPPGRPAPLVILEAAVLVLLTTVLVRNLLARRRRSAPRPPARPLDQSGGGGSRRAA